MLVLLAFAPAACSSVLGLGPRYEVPPGPRDLDAASLQERYEYMRRAQVWKEVATGSLDLLKGPPGEDAFGFDELVACDYAPKAKAGGHTPKFNCALAHGIPSG